MNMLFFVVFVLFSLLILRLGFVQIVNGEDAKRQIERTDDVTVSTSVPRGIIYDRNHTQVVSNEPQRAIMYTAPKKFDQKQTLETAEKLAQMIEKDTGSITHRDKVDFWLMKHPEEALAKVTEEELDSLESNEIYKLQRERVTDEELASLTDDELEVLAIYREMTSGYALDPQFIKNKDVTLEELAVVSEHLYMLPGVDTTMDWDRTYLYGDSLKTILGIVKPGLPAEKLDYYEARGYSRNDRVGVSYIEMQYEDVLRGQKEKTKNITRSGEVLEKELLQEGQRGKDLVLSMDMELQMEIDKIIEEELKASKEKPGTNLLDRAFVTVMDPHTGEILALSGKQYSLDEDINEYTFKDFAAGNFTTAYVPGSAIKGATVLSGYMTGVIKPGSYLIDEPIVLPSTPTMSSWFNSSRKMNINDTYAIVRSSNSYMFKLAIAMGDGQYKPGQLIMDKIKSFNQMRYHFSQFGLGIRTGIDLPGEQIGYKGNIEEAVAGNALHFAIGQYDSYTTLQLAQYISTIANGGYRMEPHVVKEIREPGDGDGTLGPIVKEIQPKVLNRIDATDKEIEHVQNAMWGVFHNNSIGTGRAFDAEPYRKYRAAGKTGTAETYDQGKKVWNLTLVGYAPFENPEIAFSVVVPSAYLDGYNDTGINSLIGKRVLKAYFDLKAERANNTADSNEDDETSDNQEENNEN